MFSWSLFAAQVTETLVQGLSLGISLGLGLGLGRLPVVQMSETALKQLVSACCSSSKNQL